MATLDSLLDKKAIRLKELFNQKSISGYDVLKADFGEWPLQNTTMQPIEKLSRPFKIYRSSNIIKNVEDILSHDHRIDQALNRQEFKRPTSGLMIKQPIKAASLLLSLSAEQTIKIIAKSPLNKFIKSPIDRREGYVRLASHKPFIFLKDDEKRPETPQILSHEFAHLLQKYNDSLFNMPVGILEWNNYFKSFEETSKSFSENDLLKKLYPNYTKKSYQYAINQMEIQAHLHEFIVAAYQANKFFPKSGSTLNLALVFAFNATNALPSTWDNNKEPGSDSRADKNVSLANDLLPLMQMFFTKSMEDTCLKFTLLFDEYLKPEKKDEFLLYAMPMLYSNLLKMYGETEISDEISKEAKAQRDRKLRTLEI